MYVSVNCSFLKEWSIGWGAALNCYLHDQQKRCAMILVSCGYEKNPYQSLGDY